MKAPKLQAFLAAIRELPHIRAAAAAAGINRTAHYRRYERDPEYRKAFDEAWRIGCGRIRDEAIQRAVKGYQEPVIYKGEFCYERYSKTIEGRRRYFRRMVTVTKYPERLLMKVLGAEIPDVYATRMHVEHSGHVALIVEQLQAARKRMQAIA